MTFPDGPSRRQTAQDRLVTGITVLQRMLKNRRALRAIAPATARWTEDEQRAYDHQCCCEIEALETAINTMQAALSVPRLQLEAMERSHV